MNQLSTWTVGVVGAGTMGAGIAQLFLRHGFEVRLFDVSDEFLARGEKKIYEGLARARDASMAKSSAKALHLTRRLEDFSDCNAVVEAATEDLTVKKDIFGRLDRIVPSIGILATNTSSLSVTEIAAAAHRPERVAGLHFFNPAPVMRLVEVVQAECTAESTMETLATLADQVEKTVIRCKDTPGFVVNRVARPYYLTGMRLLEAGAGTPEHIDRALRDGGFRMGPLELVDLIGLDVNLAISKVVHRRMGTPERLEPSKAQEALVAQGCFGRKSSRGFYVYQDGKAVSTNPLLEKILPQMGSKPLSADAILHSIWEAITFEARKAAAEDVATPKDIDTAMRLGMNWPRGPFEQESKSPGLGK